jgi:hypothetical protein
MRFAKFWAFTRLPVSRPGFDCDSVKLWGASNKSIEAAVATAERRAGQLRSFFQGAASAQQDYDYWNDFIREEVLEEITSDTGQLLGVVTRNHYGAEILNTTAVLFGDIDVARREPGFISKLCARLGLPIKNKAYYVQRLETYQRQHPELTISLFETCAGLRFVVTSQTLTPSDSFTQSMFSELGVDKLYQKLCLRQNCFRARLTPKPWRIKLERPATRFPRDLATEQPSFERWLKGYQQASADYGVVKQIQQWGNQSVPADIKKILGVHARCISKHNQPLA